VEVSVLEVVVEVVEVVELVDDEEVGSAQYPYLPEVGVELDYAGCARWIS